MTDKGSDLPVRELLTARGQRFRRLVLISTFIFAGFVGIGTLLAIIVAIVRGTLSYRLGALMGNLVMCSLVIGAFWAMYFLYLTKLDKLAANGHAVEAKVETPRHDAISPFVKPLLGFLLTGLPDLLRKFVPMDQVRYRVKVDGAEKTYQDWLFDDEDLIESESGGILVQLDPGIFGKKTCVLTRHINVWD